VVASKVGVKSPDDIVIVSALRTLMGRARKGGLKDTPVEELLSTVLKATIDKTKIDPATVGDIVVGTVLGGGSQRANECRIGQQAEQTHARILHSVAAIALSLAHQLNLALFFTCGCLSSFLPRRLP
jgi:acetyl-CoA acetyltransferase